MEAKKVIILIAADGGYEDLVQAIRETWGSNRLDGVEILYYYGYRDNYPQPAADQCLQCNDELVCGIASNDLNGRNRIAFEYLYQHYDFEYLFRCCSGSYIVQEKLLQYLQDKPKTNFYCGPITWKIISEMETVPFAIGLGVFFSRDLVKLLIDNPDAYYYDIDEDVAFGRLFSQRGISVIQAPTEWTFGGLERLDESQYQHHIRRNVSLMYELHRILYLEKRV